MAYYLNVVRSKTKTTILLNRVRKGGELTAGKKGIKAIQIILSTN